MVTAIFPFGPGEAFVQAELAHLSNYFKEIEVVPSFYTVDVKPRQVAQKVNLDYVRQRWGFFRIFHVITSFAVALYKYSWLNDVLLILRYAHKLENIKELVRSLYRAQLFEHFLEHQIVKNKKEFDLIYFYWMVPEIMGAIRFRRKCRPGLKIVSRAHGGDLYEDRTAGGYAGLRKNIVTGIDAIYCISDHGKAYLDRGYPELTQKFRTARLGVDDPGYLNAAPDRKRLSIVSCAFMVPGKRLHLIVEAIAYLLDQEPSLAIKWTHIGDGELYAQLRACVAEKLTGRAEVEFKGYLLPNQVMNLYRDERFDVIVNVSDSEGIPVSLMEASSAGIPMVATDVGGNSEIVNAGNGILIPADCDIETIAAALICFNDRVFASAYRKRARSDWSEKFNAQTNYNAFCKELVSMLAPPDNAA
jgi:colanic acid/amylovoran biosynthesis glycosyltransferase